MQAIEDCYKKVVDSVTVRARSLDMAIAGLRRDARCVLSLGSIAPGDTDEPKEAKYTDGPLSLAGPANRATSDRMNSVDSVALEGVGLRSQHL